MQKQGWASTLIFPNKSLDASCNLSICTQIFLTAILLSFAKLYLLFFHLFSSPFFLSSHYAPYFLQSAPLTLRCTFTTPLAVFFAAPAALVHHSVYMNLYESRSVTAGLPPVKCAGNRETT